MPPTPRQQRTRARFETVIGLASPLLDLVLATGDRISRTLGADDDYIPIRPSSDRFELPHAGRRPGGD